MGLGVLDEARDKFDTVKCSLQYNKNIPLSEGSEEFLATFAEDYDRYVPGPPLQDPCSSRHICRCLHSLRDQLERSKTTRYLHLRFQDASVAFDEDLTLAKALREKSKVSTPAI